MVKRTLENPCKGINAHLHSLAQNPAQGHPTIWTSIHFSIICNIVDALNNLLSLDYVARVSESLQPCDDVYGLIPLGDNEITIPSAVIYEVRDHEIEGKPVTRIELLSASNKRGGTGEDGYRKNRLEAIRSATSLIELDYLHQSASTLPRMTPYPDGMDSHPYYIALTDCRAGFPDEMRVYIRDVNQALPSKIAIPLAGEDSLVFDFEAVYQHTFRIGRWGIHIDYDELPRNFGSYSESDQQTIQGIMEVVEATI